GRVRDVHRAQPEAAREVGYGALYGDVGDEGARLEGAQLDGRRRVRDVVDPEVRPGRHVTVGDVERRALDPRAVGRAGRVERGDGRRVGGVGDVVDGDAGRAAPDVGVAAPDGHREEVVTREHA